MRNHLLTIFFVVLILLLGACGSLVHYQVKKGDSLYSIGWRYGKEAKQLAEWNNLEPPYVIHEGQMLRIAPPLDKSNPVLLQPARDSDKQHAKAAPITSSPHSNSTIVAAPKKSTPSTNQGPVIWGWPAEGKLLSTFSSKRIDRKGINIGGKRGTTVRAAARGRVVYSGSGLTHYGNLLIIKHNESYLSAYAHNDKLLVTEGEFVKQGQKIAEMGATGTDSIILHFEIRFNGKPVDPLRYLPKR